jgi:uncharacterized short protein YbdD (DUF466 family)
MKNFKKTLKLIYDYLSGEQSYRLYLQHQKQFHQHLPMTKKQFLNNKRNAKWRGVNRCC